MSIPHQGQLSIFSQRYFWAAASSKTSGFTDVWSVKRAYLKYPCLEPDIEACKYNPNKQIGNYIRVDKE